jgi:CheY-like chemotaxis protein
MVIDNGAADGNRILLVEDDFITACADSERIRKRGYSVVTAHNGELAVQAFRGCGDFDLVIMDIELGKGIDGIEAAEQIMTARDVPVIFFSNHERNEAVSRLKHLDYFGYVLKSNSEAVLFTMIEQALGCSRAAGK